MAALKVARAAEAAAEVDPIGALRTRLVTLERERDELAEQVELIEAASRPLADALAELDGVIEAAAARVQPGLGRLAQTPGQAHLVAANLCDAQTDRAPPVSGFAIACWCQPEVVRDRLEAELRAVYRSLPPPITDEERAAKLSALRAKIAETESQLVERWWKAVDSGLALPVPNVHGAVLVGLEARP
jgi:hypothetical protein